MADLVRTVELFDLLGHARQADLGRRAAVVGAYIDTGAGRTIVTSDLARRVAMIEVPHQIRYTVPLRLVVHAKMTALRLRAPGCAARPPIPILVAVSDEIIRKLELPGVAMLLGQDYLQAARVRLDLAPGREPEAVRCRPAPRSRSRYGA